MPPVLHHRHSNAFSPPYFSPLATFSLKRFVPLALCLLLAWTNQAAAQDADGSLIANATISEPIALPTTATTVGAAVNIFDFDIVDGGSADGLALAVTQLALHTSGSAGNGEYNKVTWRLNGPDASNVTGSFNAGSSTITFSGLSISVANGTSETYTVNAYYSSTGGLQDNDTFILSIDGDTDLTLGAGTTMAVTTPVTNGSGSILQVTATQLVFTSQPAPLTPTSGSALDFSTDPIVEARDANGLKDVDFTDTVTLTENGSGSATYTNNSVAAIAGVATFTGLTTTYTATADNQTFALQADDTVAGAEGDLAAVASSNLTANVLATSTSAATIAFSNLSTYADGNPQSIEVTTTPANLAVNITYNGSANSPSNPGTYQVVATINDLNYSGSANATFTITERSFAPPTIDFTASTKAGLTPLHVNFTYASTGHIV